MSFLSHVITVIWSFVAQLPSAVTAVFATVYRQLPYTAPVAGVALVIVLIILAVKARTHR